MILLLTGLVVITYLLIFGYLNMCKLVEHADSDTAAEVLLAEKIWESKDLSPDHWISSTERRIISPATLAAAFFGMGLSGAHAMGLACIIVGIMVLIAYGYLLHTVKVGKVGMVTAFLLLVCLAVNGREASDSMLPFFTYLLFLFADYYALHVIVMLLSIALYIRFSRGERKLVLLLLTGFCDVLALGLGASGMRLAQVAVLPLLAWAFLDFYKQSQEWKACKEAFKKNKYGILFVASLTVCDVLGMLYPSSADYPMFMENGENVVNRFFLQVPGAVLKCLGISGNASLKSFSGLMQLLVYAFLGLTVFAVVKVFSVAKEQKEKEQNAVLLYLLLSFAVTYFALSVTSAAVFHYYLFAVFFVEAISISLLIDRLIGQNPVLWVVIWLFIMGFGISNLIYTYVPAVISNERQTTLAEVSDYLTENGIEYAYSQFWHANRLRLVSGDRLKVGNIYNMNQLTMYWWLTDSTWYKPEVAEDTPTAYIMTKDEEPIFLEGVERDFRKDKPGDLQLERDFENKDYIVYKCNKALVGK